MFVIFNSFTISGKEFSRFKGDNLIIGLGFYFRMDLVKGSESIIFRFRFLMYVVSVLTVPFNLVQSPFSNLNSLLFHFLTPILLGQFLKFNLFRFSCFYILSLHTFWFNLSLSILIHSPFFSPFRGQSTWFLSSKSTVKELFNLCPSNYLRTYNIISPSLQD